MSGIRVVKRYARALLDAASEQEKLDEVREDLVFISSLLSGAPEIRNFCLAARKDMLKERDFINSAFIPYVGSLTARTLELIVDNGRLSAVPLLPEAFIEQEDHVSGTVHLVIEAVKRMPDEQIQEIITRMEKRTGSRIRPEILITPSLIGGLRLTWQNRTIDMSLDGRLKKLKTLLK